MSLSTKIFTAHENVTNEEPSERVAFVQEGFSYLATVFTVLWLAANRMWLEVIGYVMIEAGLYYAADMLRFSAPLFLLLQCLLQVLLGSFAFDLKRAALARKGYQFKSVVVAETPLNAQRRYFDHLA